MAKETTYEEIARELKNRIYKPVYYLMGEESYYIDRISEYIAQTVLNENEKEFNQTIVYGADTDIATVINAAKRYPMMSKYQVVIVKEAQNIKNIEELIISRNLWILQFWCYAINMVHWIEEKNWQLK